MKKVIYIAAVALVAMGFVTYSFLTPKGDINMKKAKVLHSVTALDLFSDFATDEPSSNEKYSGKVLSVSGTLNKVDRAEQGGFQLWLASGTDEGQVICNMSRLDSMTLGKLQIGQELSIKGVCTGYLFDVVLDHAVINKK